MDKCEFCESLLGEDELTVCVEGPLFNYYLCLDCFELEDELQKVLQEN